jgi:FAD binding domain
VIHDTRAGLRINARCQVLDMSGAVIQGLYCGGGSAGGLSVHGLPRAIGQDLIADGTPPQKAMTPNGLAG